MFADKPCQSMHGSQELITCADTAAAFSLDVREELTHHNGSDIHDPQAINRQSGLGCGNWEQQAERVPIAVLCVDGQVVLDNEVLEQEASDPWP